VTQIENGENSATKIKDQLNKVLYETAFTRTSPGFTGDQRSTGAANVSVSVRGVGRNRPSVNTSRVTTASKKSSSSRGVGASVIEPGRG